MRWDLDWAHWFARLVPGGVSVLAVLMNFVPIGLPLGLGGQTAPLPLFGLMAVYHFSLYHPALMPRWAMLAIGLLHDAISGQPVGLMALTLLVVREFCVSQRQLLLSGSFAQVWLGFAAICALTAILGWVVFVFFQGALAVDWAALIQIAVTVAAFPVGVWVFSRAERAIPSFA